MSNQETNSVLRRKTRYVSGGVTEVSQGRLEWWERNTMTAGNDDRVYTVERKFEGRLDLIAALFLGEPRLWWLLAQYNTILDPYAEVVEGAQIVIPSADRLSTLLQGRTGGVQSTREVPTTILPIV